MNVLVVDDEYYIVQGIVNTIDCSKLGISSIYSAYSMKQAQKVFQEHEVDVLVTDIEMPKGSGIDLVRWTYENDYMAVVIFLTGHQNFDYAYTAIKLQCLDYILKPIKPADLEKNLREAIRVAEDRVKSFWLRLLTTDVPFDKEKISNILKEAPLPQKWLNRKFYFVYCLVTADSADFTKRKEDFFVFCRDLLVKNCMTGSASAFVKLEDNKYVLPILSDEYPVYDLLLDNCKKVLSSLAGIFPYCCTMFVSDACQLTDSFECLDSLKTYGESFLSVNSKVIPLRKLDNRDYSEHAATLPDIPVSRWCEWLLQYKTDLILADIQALLKNDSRLYPSDSLITLYYSIIQTVFSTLSKKNIDAKMLFPKISDHSVLTKAITSVDNFLSWVKMILGEAKAILLADSDSVSLLSAVKRIVREHLNSGDLSRTLIADEIHMNADYLSYLFHKKTGQSLVSFITEERISAAKTLLLITDETMPAIAETIGYFNTSYFFRQFKKITGMTPQQYRETGRQSGDAK